MSSGTALTGQKRPDQLVDVMRTDFIHRNEPAQAWKSAISAHLALPALRAFWPMSAVGRPVANRGVDLGGGAYDLTDNNTVLFGGLNLAPYAEFDGVNQFLSRADAGAATWADIVGTEAWIDANWRGLTLGGWFRFDVLGNQEGMIGKWVAAGNQCSYHIYKQAANTVVFQMSQAGAGATASAVSAAAVVQNSWYHAVGRFDPATDVSIWLNGVETAVATAAPWIFDSNSPFEIARTNAAFHLDGKASLCFLCAAALSDSVITALWQWTRRMFGR